MSYSFYIHDVADVSLRKTLDALPFDNLVVDPEAVDEGWPGVVHIYQNDVSVRSVETSLENGTLQVRILAFSSLDDFGLAAAITELVARTHDRPIEPEDDEPMPVERWAERYGPTWQTEQCDSHLKALVGLYRQRGSMSMWGTRADFQAGPRLMEPLLTDPENFSTNFFNRVRRFNYIDREDVFVAYLAVARAKETSKEAVFSVLGPGVPTALSTQAAFVVLADDEQKIVTFDDFVELAGDSLTWLGDSLALTPAYSEPEWRDLLSQARARSVEFGDRPDLLRDPEGSPTTDVAREDELGISAKHWEVLALAPVAVFLLTASADGKVDRKEVVAFQKQMMKGAVSAGDSEIMQRAIVQAAIGIEKRFAYVGQMQGEEVAALVAGSRQVVEQALGDREAAAYARALYDIAEAIAKASGGFLGFGSKVGKEEKMVLDSLRKLLELDA